MNKKIEKYVEELFKDIKSGQHVSDVNHISNKDCIADVMEELLANLNDKYNDLISSGKGEEEAFSLVISSIGDIHDLISDLSNSPDYNIIEIEKSRKIRSLLVSISVSIYILSLTALVFFAQFNHENAGRIIMLAICAIATGVLVYGINIGKTTYERANDSFVEQFKEKVSVNDRNSKLKRSLSSTMWTLIVVLYLAISFITGAWHVSWILYLVGACLQQLINYIYTEPARRKNLWHGLLWTSTVIIYFIISFLFSLWAWSWMIFIISAAVEQLIRTIMIWRSE